MHLFGKSAVAFLLLVSILNPSHNWELSVQKNLVEPALKTLSFEEDEVIIAISRNQCTRCNRSMIDLVNTFYASDRKVTVIRLLDSALMECKKDELFFRDEYPDLRFEYTADKILRLNRSAEDSIQVNINKTPILITMRNRPKIYDSDDLIDKYGYLKKIKLD